MPLTVGPQFPSRCAPHCAIFMRASELHLDIPHVEAGPCSRLSLRLRLVCGITMAPPQGLSHGPTC